MTPENPHRVELVLQHQAQLAVDLARLHRLALRIGVLAALGMGFAFTAMAASILGVVL